VPLPAPLNLLDSSGHAPFATVFTDYFDALRARAARRQRGALVGHTALRASCMASVDRAATPAEAAAMRQLLQQGLDDGAIGLSTGTFYPPAAAAPTEEIVELGQPLTAARRPVRDPHARRVRRRDGGAGRDLPHRARTGRAGGGVAPQGACSAPTSGAPPRPWP
jgi:hypothetical protein